MKILDKVIKLCDERYKGYTIKPLEGRKGTSMHGAVGAYKNSELEFTADNVKELKKEIDALDPPVETTFTFRAMVEHNGVPSYRRISVVSTSREKARKEAEKLKHKEERIVD